MTATYRTARTDVLNNQHAHEKYMHILDKTQIFTRYINMKLLINAKLTSI